MAIPELFQWSSFLLPLASFFPTAQNLTVRAHLSSVTSLANPKTIKPPLLRKTSLLLPSLAQNSSLSLPPLPPCFRLFPQATCLALKMKTSSPLLFHCSHTPSSVIPCPQPIPSQPPPWRGAGAFLPPVRVASPDIKRSLPPFQKWKKFNSPRSYPQKGLHLHYIELSNMT